MSSSKSRPVPRLLKETRCNSSTTPGSIIQIQVTPPSFPIRTRQDRRILRSDLVFNSENEFQNHYFATSSALFQSQHHPRIIQWRVIHDHRILELRRVDLSQRNSRRKPARHILQLCFGPEIKQGGVCLADSDESINLFVLTRSHEIYTFALREEFFCDESSSGNSSEWCKIARPATFSISAPHCLIAQSNTQLFASLIDGRILRLTRDSSENGSKWSEAIYGDGQWVSSLLGLVKWQQSDAIQFDGRNLSHTTPLSLAISPDHRHVFALCIDHTLRVWNPNKASAVFAMDLLWNKNGAKQLICPDGPKVLGLLKTSSLDGEYIGVTYSPLSNGQFKIWAFRDPDFGETGVRDMFPDTVLGLIDPDSSPNSQTLWKLVDFAIQEIDDQLELWILLRSSRQYKVYHLKSNLMDLASSWETQWSEVIVADESHLGMHTNIPAYQASDEWASFILQPGRFSRPVIKNALQIFCTNRKISLNEKASLAQNMKSAIATHSRRELAKASDEGLLNGWTLLWQDIVDLDRSCYTVSSISLHENAWLLFADASSVIRSCSPLETLVHNTPDMLAHSQEFLQLPSVEMSDEEPKLPDELALIIDVASTLRLQTASLRSSFKSAIEQLLTTDPGESEIQVFYQDSQLANVDDAVFDHIANEAFNLIDGLTNIDNESFFSILETFDHLMPDVSSDHIYTDFGRKLLINGARDAIEQRYGLLLDLLRLVVFIEMEVDDEKTLMKGFEPQPIFNAIHARLLQYRLLDWLCKNDRNDTTLLEQIFAADLQPQSTETQAMCQALTQSIQDCIQWALGGNNKVPWDEIPVHIMCDLLVHRDLELASDFLKLLPKTSWASYTKGRLCILQSEHEDAARFMDNAKALSRPSNISFRHASRGLLSSDEAAQLGHGLTSYYAHIAQLFSNVSNEYTAQFATSALDRCNASSEQTASLLSILFDASIKDENYLVAYSALDRYPTPTSLLPKLVSAILAAAGSLPNLLSIPWDAKYISKVDEILCSQNAHAKTIASWRIERSDDYRGAAAALMPGLVAKQAKATRRGALMATSGAADDLSSDYLTIINLLACAGEDNAWVLSGGGKSLGVGKRKVVTLADLRKSYEEELDRRSMLEGGNFPFTSSDGKDVDMELAV